MYHALHASNWCKSVHKEPKSIASLRSGQPNIQAAKSAITVIINLPVCYQTDKNINKKVARSMHSLKRSTDIPYQLLEMELTLPFSIDG